jgi:fission process protein 1
MAQENDQSRYLAYVGRLRNIARVGYRYLAFTSDVGEAIRPIVSKPIVTTAYGISFAYVGADIAYHTASARDNNGNVWRTFCERSVFQGLASLLLPAITIHTAVDLFAKMLGRVNAPKLLMRWGPSCGGLLLLPALPTLLDHPVEHGVDLLFAKLWPKIKQD